MKILAIDLGKFNSVACLFDDDALKLAKLAALDQISTVHVPIAAHRQYRSLVKYRKTLVHRLNRVQNTIRSLFDQQGIPIPQGQRAWTVAGWQRSLNTPSPWQNVISMNFGKANWQ
jgi:transposase